MSGMLVPVGVGIAGALFILGALYSIKIMSRRRRNGSKRHKRKVWQLQRKTPVPPTLLLTILAVTRAQPGYVFFELKCPGPLG